MSVLIINNIANTTPGIANFFSSGGEVVSIICIPNRGERALVSYIIDLGVTVIKAYKLAFQARIVYVNYALHAIPMIPFWRRLVVHCHGTDIRANMLNRWALPTRMVLKAARVIFVSTPDLLDYVPTPQLYKTTYLPNPIDVKKIAALDGQRPEVRNSGITVMLISKIDKTKGIDSQLRVVEGILDFPHIVCIKILNFGNEIAEHQIPVNKKITLLDRMSHSEMLEEVLDADIVLGQLKLGVLGVSELEAMCLDKLVVAYVDLARFYGESIPLISSKDVDNIIIEINQLRTKEAIAARLSQLPVMPSHWVEKHFGYGEFCERIREKVSALL